MQCLVIIFNKQINNSIINIINNIFIYLYYSIDYVYYIKCIHLINKLFNRIYMKYLIISISYIPIEVFITNNILYKNVLLTNI